MNVCMCSVIVLHTTKETNIIMTKTGGNKQPNNNEAIIWMSMRDRYLLTDDEHHFDALRELVFEWEQCLRKQTIDESIEQTKDYSPVSKSDYSLVFKSGLKSIGDSIV